MTSFTDMEKFPRIPMEPQNTQDTKNIRKAQAILQSHSSKSNMELAHKKTCRSLKQNRRPKHEYTQ